MSTDVLERVLVWEGRFQPIHKGHVAYVRELVSLCQRLVIVVVANEVSAGRPTPVPEFSTVVDGHHGSEKNPWPLWLRYQLVSATLRSEFPDAQIDVLSGHRLDLDWDLYDQLLPPERIFAVPTRDDFEDAKAAAWTKLGQRVRRVDVGHLPPLSGTQVRALLDSGADLQPVLEPITYELLTEYLSAGSAPAGRLS